MATFRIHEDIEKENSDYTAPLRAKDGKPARQFSERCSNVEANPKNRQAFTKATVVESVIQKSTTVSICKKPSSLIGILFFHPQAHHFHSFCSFNGQILMM